MRVIPVTALHQRGFGETLRRDAWWRTPVFVLAVLSAFLIYATWAAHQNAHYTFGPYLSPFYSPELFGSSPHAWFGPKPDVWPAWLPFSPALLILPFPGLFRFTCYYYRGAYYKGFWADPPNCAVGEPRKSYWGEARLPLILQNIHRYFLFISLGFLLFLSYDVWLGMWFTDPATGQQELGLGVGTLVLALNVVLLALYVFGCHSLRHVVGGRCDEMPSNARATAYRCVSCLNRRHMLYAWCSLLSVAFADIYVRLCALGVWTDLRLL
ncbi:MAG TPA: hypothetical protein VFZ36_07110 [Vicinamibacterales bacterium]